MDDGSDYERGNPMTAKNLLMCCIALSLIAICIFSGFGHYPTNKINVAIGQNDTETALALIEKANVKDLDMKSHNSLGELLLLESGIPSDYPILAATWHANYEVTKALVEKGVNVNVRNKNNQTPLIYALRSVKPERYKIANCLLDNGADASLTDNIGLTAASYAPKTLTIEKNPELAQEQIDLLIRLGYDEETAIAETNIGD